MVSERSKAAGDALLSVDRLMSFTDGVVAIAMTLLILPLMDSVSELGDKGRTVAEYLSEDRGQLISFVMSFALIASFWVTHHRILARVERTSPGLTWLTIAWMFTIVWLPVPTAMLGSMPADPAQKGLYVGTLMAASLMLLLTRLHLRRHCELHGIPEEALRAGILSEVVVIVLFAIALAVAIVAPGIGYSAMFLMLLTGPAVRVISALARGRRRGR